MTAAPLLQQFYVCPPGKEEFTLGPYLSREAAAEEAPREHRFPAGSIFSVGILQPYSPTIDAAALVAGIAGRARASCQPQAIMWADSLQRLSTKQSAGTDLRWTNADELGEALSAVLLGWLARHEAFPTFGLVSDITEHTAPAVEDAPNAMEAAWGLICNAGGGDWSTQSQEWQEAARRWRDAYWPPVPPCKAGAGFGPGTTTLQGDQAAAFLDSLGIDEPVILQVKAGQALCRGCGRPYALCSCYPKPEAENA